MLCEKCKVREANIKYTEIINGVKTEHNLCSHCAKEIDFGQYTALLDGEFPLGKLLSGLLGLEEDEEETDVRSRVGCPTGGTSFDDFVQNSRFGCPDCYGVFDLFINDKIKQLQGSESHRGKQPKYQRAQETISENNEEMVPADVLQKAGENAAKEQHVVDVANFLNSMGANIRGAGTDVIRIVGVEKLHATEYSIIPDQIEAGTFMFAAAATKGDITVRDVIPKHLESLSAKLLEIGCQVIEGDDSVRVIGSKELKSTNVKTLPYPGFPTDMQPQMAVVLALANGSSMVTESIFENRFKYVDELNRMGSKIKVEGNTAYIEGVSGFTGAQLAAPDLRAGAALVLAALAAEGISEIEDIEYIQRGYEDFEGKLRSLGALIERVDSERDVQKFKLKIG